MKEWLMMHRAGVILAWVAMMMLGSACTIQGDAQLFPEQSVQDVPGDTVSFPENLQAIIGANCSGGGCHTDGQTTAGLNLDPGNEEANLVAVPSASNPSAIRVVPGDPVNSLLIWRLRELNGNSVMPPGYATTPGPLEESDIVAFEDWILGLEVTQPPDDVIDPPDADTIDDVPDVTDVPDTLIALSSVDEVFATYCIGCHVGGNGFGNLKLDADLYEENLVGVPSKKKPGILRVIPGDPENSFILWRLEATHDQTVMPLPPNKPVPEVHIAIVTDWILSLEPPCEPECAPSTCGDDGCGGVCGPCEANEECDEQDQCICVPSCTDKACGDDGCGDECGTCTSAQDECVDNQCVCVPSCTDKACGDDGCGSECGTCTGTQDACVDNQCVCQPVCTGKVCGDDGCGTSCGDCPNGEKCEAASGQCVSDCTADCTDKNCGNDGCGGSCGACTDPDTCNTEGQCVCVPSCTGKTCGDDGCGDVCGTCTGNDACTPEGQCVCAPDCAGKACGDNGCGDVCGTCATTEECDANNQCVALPQVPANVSGVFQTYCLDCHSSAYPENGMNLSEGFAYANLVGQPAVNDPAVLRVKPSDPDNSYLMWRLQNMMNQGYMPPDYAGSPGPIPADQVAIVSAWIASLTPESN
jgi:hypothetical protein